MYRHPKAGFKNLTIGGRYIIHNLLFSEGKSNPLMYIKGTGFLFPAKLQTFEGNITFVRCLDHILDEIGFGHGLSWLQVQSQSSGPVHMVVDAGTCGDPDLCGGDGFCGSIGKFQCIIGFHVIGPVFDACNTGFQIFDSRFGCQFGYGNGDFAVDAV